MAKIIMESDNGVRLIAHSARVEILYGYSDKVKGWKYSGSIPTIGL